MQRIAILGSTGSIGRQTLDVIARHPDQYQVEALTANSNVDDLFSQCVQYRPNVAAMASPAAADMLQEKIKTTDLKTTVLAGPEALVDIASDRASQIVVAAIVGGAGLLSSLAAAKAGKRILLANKESLVMSGQLFMTAVQQSGAEIMPVDSEHNAIFQCMPAGYLPGQACPPGVDSIVLTASGGPFRTIPVSKLASVTPKQAVAHPNWSMGAKISVDCATMINKGLELIEAHWLFALPSSRIEVVIHPQSTIHSFVRYIDGSLLAQLGEPDMRTPIACALSWPKRIRSGAANLDLTALRQLDFEPLDEQRYPCFRLVKQALQAGGSAACSMNAANEVAVAAFLNNQIGFLQIAEIIERVLDKAGVQTVRTVDDILMTDQQARQLANKCINQAGSHRI